MMALYRQHVLGEKPAAGGFVPISAVAPAGDRPSQVEERQEERELLAGD